MVSAIDTAMQGLQSATQRVNKAAENISKFGTGLPNDKGDEVNLSEEAVNLMTAKTAYKANVAVIKVTEELTEELLNTFDKEV